jgi:hypothetical protein
MRQTFIVRLVIGLTVLLMLASVLFALAQN